MRVLVLSTMALCVAGRIVPTVEVAPGVELPMMIVGGVNGTNTPMYPQTSNYSLWLQLGGRGIDTAWEYQTSAGIAKAVRDSGIPRSEIFIEHKIPGSLHRPCSADKCKGFPSPPPVIGHYTPDMARAYLADNLHRLGEAIGYIDLLLIHEPCDYGSKVYSEEAARECAAIWGVLEEALSNGTARAIGVSNFGKQQLEALMSVATVKPVVNQCRMAVGTYDKETHDYCREHGITYQAYSPLQASKAGSALAESIGLAHNVSKYQVMLRWHAQHGVPFVTASEKESHLVSDMAIFDFNLTDADMDQLDNVKKIVGGVGSSQSSMVLI